MFSWKRFIQASMTRAIRTMAQTALASLTTCFLIQDVDTHILLGSVALSGVYSVLTSLATGLPEVPEVEGTNKEEERKDYTIVNFNNVDD